MRVEFRDLTTQQRAVFALVDHYYEAVGEPVPAAYVARRLFITKQRAAVIFNTLHRHGWLKGPGAPAVPSRRLPPDVRMSARLAPRRDLYDPEKVPPGKVYFLRNGEAVKIGYSKDLPARIRILKTANAGNLELLGWVKGNYMVEREIQRRFSALRVRGEWFRAEPELIEWIELHSSR